MYLSWHIKSMSSAPTDVKYMFNELYHSQIYFSIKTGHADWILPNSYHVAIHLQQRCPGLVLYLTKKFISTYLQLYKYIQKYVTQPVVLTMSAHNVCLGMFWHLTLLINKSGSRYEQTLKIEYKNLFECNCTKIKTTNVNAILHFHVITHIQIL